MYIFLFYDIIHIRNNNYDYSSSNPFCNNIFAKKKFIGGVKH